MEQNKRKDLPRARTHTHAHVSQNVAFRPALLSGCLSFIRSPSQKVRFWADWRRSSSPVAAGACFYERKETKKAIISEGKTRLRFSTVGFGHRGLPNQLRRAAPRPEG